MNRILQVYPAARADIQQYFLYILKDSEDAAFAFVTAAESTMQRLLDWPGTGHPRATINPSLIDIRSIPVEGFPNHLIFYRITDDAIRVLRIRHGAMDLDAVSMQDDE